ncbi:MAG TPA: hypothetical protein VGF14_05285 [Alphaproteobacteria bacterium]
MKYPLIIVSALLLSACANSASHDVLQVSKSADEYLDCPGIKMEKVKAQSVIDGVNQDKEDMTGADVVDGLLWFPFNVMAKQSNYTNATKAANERLDYLTVIEKEKKCKK